MTTPLSNRTSTHATAITGTTVIDILVEVHLTAIGGYTIAVGKPAVTLNDHALGGGAFAAGVRQVALVGAEPTVVRVLVEICLATVAVVAVAVPAAGRAHGNDTVARLTFPVLVAAARKAIDAAVSAVAWIEVDVGLAAIQRVRVAIVETSVTLTNCARP